MNIFEYVFCMITILIYATLAHNFGFPGGDPDGVKFLCMLAIFPIVNFCVFGFGALMLITVGFLWILGILTNFLYGLII